MTYSAQTWHVKEAVIPREALAQTGWGTGEIEREFPEMVTRELEGEESAM